MIRYLFLLIFLASPLKAQEVLIIPIEEYDASMHPDKKIGIVDKLGNIEWRNPVPKPKPVYEITITKAPVINKYKKGVSSTWQVDVQADLYGYLNGASVGLRYKKNNWSLGTQIKYNTYASPQGYDETHLIGLAQLSYHLRPNWYVSSPTHPRFDPAIYLSLGYDKADVMDVGFVYGVGIWVGHQLFSPKTQIYTSVESLQKGSDGLSNTFSVGLRYSFK